MANVLARRLDAIGGPAMSVVDEGITGDQLLTDSSFAGLSGLHRLARDVIGQPGAKVVIMLLGINDIGFTDLGLDQPPATAAFHHRRLPAGHRPRARGRPAHHRRHLDTFPDPARRDDFLTLPVATSGYQDAQGEIVRAQVNHWILTSAAFDGTIDFSAAVASPYDPQAINPAYDSGDHLPPNDVGYQVMGDTFPLRLLLGDHG